jgi:hypothetical protein
MAALWMSGDVAVQSSLTTFEISLTGSSMVEIGGVGPDRVEAGEVPLCSLRAGQRHHFMRNHIRGRSEGLLPNRIGNAIQS